MILHVAVGKNQILELGCLGRYPDYSPRNLAVEESLCLYLSRFLLKVNYHKKILGWIKSQLLNTLDLCQELRVRTGANLSHTPVMQFQVEMENVVNLEKKINVLAELSKMYFSDD